MLRAPALPALLALASPVLAIDVYAGATVGQDLDGRFDGAPGNVDVERQGKLFVGLAFGNRWSLELSRHAFGEARCCDPDLTDFAFDTDTDGWSLGAVYWWSLDRWHPFVKLGWFDADSEGSLITFGGPVDFEAGEDSVMAEVGIEFDLHERFALRSGVEWFDFDGGSDAALNLGVEVRF